MALTTEQIKKSFNEMVGEILKEGPMPFTKADIKDAISAVDTWTTDNAASYNTALPQPFKGAASASMKALLLAYVALRRAGK